jgi:hypothetical protein
LPNQNEGKIMVDSSQDELEKLKNQRAEFESKLAAKWKYRTPLELEAEVLRKKVAIQKLKEELGRVDDRAAKIDLERRELEDRLKSTKEVATSRANPKLEANVKVSELEHNLKSTKEVATSRANPKLEANVKDKIDQPKTDEKTRVIWKKDEKSPVNWKENEQTPESDETVKSKESKKKRKFF